MLGRHYNWNFPGQFCAFSWNVIEWSGRNWSYLLVNTAEAELKWVLVSWGRLGTVSVVKMWYGKSLERWKLRDAEMSGDRGIKTTTSARRREQERKVWFQSQLNTIVERPQVRFLCTKVGRQRCECNVYIFLDSVRWLCGKWLVYL